MGRSRLSILLALSVLALAIAPTSGRLERAYGSEDANVLSRRELRFGLIKETPQAIAEKQTEAEHTQDMENQIVKIAEEEAEVQAELDVIAEAITTGKSSVSLPPKAKPVKAAPAKGAKAEAAAEEEAAEGEAEKEQEAEAEAEQEAVEEAAVEDAAAAEKEAAAAGEGEPASEGEPGDAADVADFWVAVYRSFLVILFLEIGDRTFFIAALLSTKHPQGTVFLGAWGALFVMTAISCALGVAAPLLLPRSLTHWAGAALFLLFGVQLLWKAYSMPAGEGADEMAEVEGELKETDARTKYGAVTQYLSPVVVQSFVMTFLAEWGDRSQIATITMAADYNPWGITVGGSMGHFFATGAAVIGGRLLASRINERTVAFAGGACFLLFGILAVLENPDTDYASAIPSIFLWAKGNGTAAVAAAAAAEGPSAAAMADEGLRSLRRLAY